MKLRQGKWTKRVSRAEKPHMCKPPFVNQRRDRDGDEWTCKCGEVWLVTSMLIAVNPTKYLLRFALKQTIVSARGGR